MTDWLVTEVPEKEFRFGIETRKGSCCGKPPVCTIQSDGCAFMRQKAEFAAKQARLPRCVICGQGEQSSMHFYEMFPGTDRHPFEVQADV